MRRMMHGSFSPTFCFDVSLSHFVCFLSQHQQQVVQAVERAKQVTMAELNAIIGVGVLHAYTCTQYLSEGNVVKRGRDWHKKIIFKVEEEPDTDANAKWTTGDIHSPKVC